MRLFMCVWIPDELKEKIKNFQQKMINLPMKAKFVETDNLHFTITFLGEINENELSDLKNKLDDSVKDIDKFNVKIEELKVIPSKNYARVIGLKVKDGEKIANLIESVTSLIGGKYYLEQKITLCRIKNVLDKKELQKFIETNEDVKIGEFQVDAVSIAESKLTRSGPIYKTIYDSHLK